MSDKAHRAGVAHVLALVFLVLLSVLAVALTAATVQNLRAGENHRRAMDAQLAAESGMAFMISELRYVRLPPGTTEETMQSNLLAVLGARLNGTANLNGQPVGNDSWQVFVPEVQLPEGSFSCRLWPMGSDKCGLLVRGTAEGLTRSLTIDLLLVPEHSAVFDYGIVSFGPISISGSAKVIGVNDPAEASVLAAATGAGVAATLDGNAIVSGDLTTVGDSAVAISGTPSLGGTTDPEEMSNHIHSLAVAPEVPTVDTASLAGLATNVVDASTNTATPGLTFNNIRIAANTNPTFTSDVTINGIVYVEAPNIVSFTDRVTLNGMIVTEDSDQPIESCQLDFSGHVEAYGVETLPDVPEFADIKQHPGTFLLAPSFGVTFSGQFATVNGTIAADQLIFTGQSEGIVNGAVIGLTDRPTILDGKVEIHVDKVNRHPDPAGFVKTFALEAQPASYIELVGG